ncbi:MAG: hypothetical protein NW207_09760 [Cytophagales bacterium]|nr:hypothetical protein [Cytophagales bacterium]
MSMRLIEVTLPEHKKQFLHFPITLYKNEPRWLRPLDKDVQQVFDPNENKFFKHGECTRWILKNSQNETIGRVAAFINNKTASATEYKTGGLGFFDCIDDYEAAKVLFDACKKWNMDRGMEAMDGPINFGERDKWWGCLVDGFELEPNYCMPYNFSYYKNLFENFGFKNYFEQYTYSMPVQTVMPEIYQQKADRIARNPLYSFKHFDKKQLEKFSDDFLYVYNKAWSKHDGVRGMNKAHAMIMFKKIYQILDEEIIWFAYYENEPCGFFIMIPELNQIFKHLNGKLDWIGKIKFVYHQWMHTCKKMFGVAFGIIPEHQGKGLEGAIVMAAAKIVQPKARYDIFEMNWIGDFNPKMIHLIEQVGAHVVKTHITYRYIFDTNKPFSRAKVIH